MLKRQAIGLTSPESVLCPMLMPSLAQALPATASRRRKERMRMLFNPG
jgi:hypothetical protein